MLVVAAVALLQFAPVLAGRVYRFEDIAGYFEPLWTAAARAMRSGRWPGWDSGAWSGQPLLGDPQLGAFYPPHWLWLGLPILRAYAVLILVHALWGGLGMAYLVRARGGSPAAQALGGVALGVGGYVVLQVRHIMFVEATAWIPWVALAGSRYLERGEPRWLAATVASLGLLFLTGGVSMIYYGLWFVAAVLLPAAWAAPPPVRWRRLAAVGLAGLLGVALAAPMLLPMAAHARLSPRARGTEYAFAASIAWRDWRYLPTLFLPNLLGQEVRGNYIGGGTQWELAGYYAGIVPFALAVYLWIGAGAERLRRRSPAALAGACRPARRGELLLLGAICLLAVLLAPGANSAAHRLAYRWLPLYDSMRCPPRALYVFSLTIPLLGAAGLDRLRMRLGARAGDIAGIALVAFTAGDLLITNRHENPSTTLAEAHTAATPEALGFLAARLSETRAEARARDGARGDRYVNDVRARHDLHNSGLLWGLENASGYSSLPLWRYLHYLWIANHGDVYPHPRLASDLAAQGIWRFGSPLMDALSVRWVLSRRTPPPAHFVRRHIAPSPPGDGLDVYENLHALPRAWLVHQAQVTPDADAAARAIASPHFDPRRTAILEEVPAVMPAPPSSDATRERLLRRPISDVAIDYDAELETPGVLVMSEPYDPNWSVTVDGAPARLLVTNYALRGVALPPGPHHIEARYENRALRRGQWTCLGALLVVAGLLLLDRHHPRASRG
jgi:hypothetical protein